MCLWTVVGSCGERGKREKRGWEGAVEGVEWLEGP